MITSKIEMRNDHSNSARRIFLGLGSNLGNREANLSEAERRIRDSGLSLIRLSSIYETEPVGYLDQPWFLNQVIEVESGNAIDPIGLLDGLLRIEHEMGRRREKPNGPRLIDIDLLLFGDVILSLEKITLPHPRMHLRRFVLEPLGEIAPGLKHPVIGKSVAELLAALDDPSTVRIYKAV